MKRKIIFTAFVMMIGVSVFATDIGNYRIPAAVKVGGVDVAAGTYLVQIEDGAEGPYVQLSKDGAAVGKELAIVIPAKGPGKNSVQVATVQEFIRLRIRNGENWYYAYLPKH